MRNVRIFLLSPAHAGGRRAELLFRDSATFPLARRLRDGELVTLGEAFSFMSGLYFRGKLAYARRFVHSGGGIYLITTDRGLVSPDAPVTLDDLRAFGTSDVDVANPKYRVPLARDAGRLAHRSPEVILLGSVATGKYLDLLLEHFGHHLLFPTEFIGRGDMSRGALLLRAAAEGAELAYQPIIGSALRGRRVNRVSD